MREFKRIKAHINNKKGFTLIEIIVVLVILAILAAALIPTMIGYVNDARQKTQLATAHAYYVAAKAVFTEEMGLTGVFHAYSVNSVHPSIYNQRWRELTIDLPGQGFAHAEAADKNFYCTVKVDNANDGTADARIEYLQYGYAKDKNIRLTPSTTGGDLLIEYNSPTTS